METLEQAAVNYYNTDHIYTLQTIGAFKAGAEWQKEQLKQALDGNSEFVLSVIRHSNIGNQVREILTTLIERLQD